MTRLLAVAAMAALVPIGAAAQPSADVTVADAAPASVEITIGDAAQPPPAPGPLVFERVHSGFAITPEAKVTAFDRRASGLVGGTAGWVKDEMFFIGGGGYWMPERRSNDRQLAYGGLVFQWFVINTDRIGLSARALVGGGRATLPDTVTQVIGLPDARTLARLTPAEVNNLVQQHTVVRTIGLRQDIAVAEPEVTAHIRLGGAVSITAGAGYRFAGSTWRDFDRGRNGVDRRLSGAVGTIGLQIGGS